MIMTFTISIPGVLQLMPGQQVDFTTPLIQSAKREGFRLEIADELGIPNDKIFMHLIKIVGDTVEANEILATKKSTFGTKQIASPKSGIIKLIDHESGSLVIETLSESSDTEFSFFIGTVKEVKDNEVSLEVASCDTYKLRDAVGDFGGEIMYRDEQHLNDLTQDDLENKVVFTESIRPAEAVRLDVLGARGIITKEDVREKEGVNSAELLDKNLWSEVSESQHTHCIVDKKNSTMYLYSLEK